MAISETARPVPVNVRWNPFDQSWSAVSVTDEDRQIPASSPYWVCLYEVPRQDTPSGVTLRLIVELGEPLDDSETDVDLASAADWARVNVNDVILVDIEQMLVTSKGASPTVNVTRGYGGTTPATHTTGTIMELLNSMTEVAAGSPADRQFRVDYTEARSALILFNSGQSEDWVRVDYYGLGTPFNTGVEWPESMIADDACTLSKVKKGTGSGNTGAMGIDAIGTVATSQNALSVQIYSPDAAGVRKLLRRVADSTSTYTEYVAIHNETGSSGYIVTAYWTYLSASKNRVVVYYDRRTGEILATWESGQPDEPVDRYGKPSEYVIFDENHPAIGFIERMILPENHPLSRNRESEGKKARKRGKSYAAVLFEEYEIDMKHKAIKKKVPRKGA